MASFNKSLYAVFFSLLFLASLKYTFYSHVALYTLLSTKQEKCSPFLADPPEQYYAHIDGHRYPRKLPEFMNKSIDFECLNANAPKKKVILMWTTYFNRPLNYTFAMDKGGYCPVRNCEVTNDEARLTEADVVCAHIREGDMSPAKLPKTRAQSQRWVLF